MGARPEIGEELARAEWTAEEEACPHCGGRALRLVAVREEGRAFGVCAGCFARGPTVIAPGWPSSWPEGVEWALDEALARWLERAP